jgi:predicted MFS family arabinose efflux permease
MRKIAPAWRVVAITALVLLVTAGSRAAPGALLSSMEKDTGWSNSALSFAAALGLIMYGLGGPFAGSLMGRFGPRRITLVSVVVTSASMMAASQANNFVVLALVFGLLAGLGAGLVASVLGTMVATRWFVTHRGLVLGIFGASVSAGQLIFYPILTRIGVEVGWREALLAFGAMTGLVIIPTALFMRNDPAELGEKPIGSSGPVAVAQPPEHGVMGRAIRHPAFWLLAGTFFVCGATSNGLVGQHFISHAEDHGFAEVTAANWLAVMGVFNFIGTIGSGLLTDRVDPRKLLLGYYAFRGVSLLFLPFVHDSLSIGAFAVLFGLDYIATVPPTIALCADLFGARNAGVVYGWVFAAHQVGAAGAAWAAGAARDGLGDYDAAFLSAGLIAIAAGVAASTISRTPATAPT